MKEKNSDRLRKLRNLFEIPNKAFSKFYSCSEHLTVDETIVLLKGSVIFRQYVPEKHESFGIKIYKTCDQTVYTCDMTVYCLLIDTNSTQQRLVCPVSESEATKMSRVNCKRCEVKRFRWSVVKNDVCVERWCLTQPQGTTTIILRLEFPM